MSKETQQRETLRALLLQIANDAAPNGLTIPLFVFHLGMRRFRQFEGEEALAANIQYLADAGMLTLVGKLISPENKAWRITKGGQDFLAEQGLE